MNKKSSDERRKFNAMWLVIGVGVGTGIGIATKNPGVGTGVGAAIGMIFAMVLPKKK